LRLLASEFQIRSNSSDILASLRDMAPRAQQDQPILSRHAWHIAATPGYYRLIDENGVETIAFTAVLMENALRTRVGEQVFAALPHHSVMYAAIGHYAGHGFLLAGGGGSGKTTLAIALLLAGIEVSGDNLVLLRDGQAMAYPRRFFFWESTRSLLPTLPLYSGPPLLLGGGRELMSPIDPIDLGCDWRIGPTPIAAVFCLDPNFGGISTLRRCGTLEALQRIVPHCAPPESGDPTWIGRLCAMLDRTQTAILTLGSLDSAIRWIRIALERLPPAETPAR